MIAIARPSVIFNALIVCLGFYYLQGFDPSPKAQSIAMLLIPTGSMALLYHLWIRPSMQNLSAVRLLSTMSFVITTTLAAAFASVHFGVFAYVKVALLAILVGVCGFELLQYKRRNAVNAKSSLMK